MLGFVIGDNDMVTGFRLVGVEGVEVTSPEEAGQALKNTLNRNDVAVIIMSQAFSSNPTLKEEINTVRRERSTPLILEIQGSKGPSIETSISDLVTKVIGVKV